MRNLHLKGKTLRSTTFKTPLGDMLVIADEEALYLLEFTHRRNLDISIHRLEKLVDTPILQGQTASITSIQAEMAAYFSRELREFQTPIRQLGTPFQHRVWQALIEIPYGQTKSYKEQAEWIGQPSAYRAVANANGANSFAIRIPCHRVITHEGHLGGYAGGLDRKQWLLDHEACFARNNPAAQL
jgi:AraC family transcriptional regulator of adaptative response/methylated-DNA-[protein]-cysteine methyltransferase